MDELRSNNFLEMDVGIRLLDSQNDIRITANRIARQALMNLWDKPTHTTPFQRINLTEKIQEGPSFYTMQITGFGGLYFKRIQGTKIRGNNWKTIRICIGHFIY